MISIILGLPGEGKSLTTSMQIKKDLDAGIQVYTSLHLNETRPNYHFFEMEDWEVVLTLQDGNVYLEEGQFILDAREWAKLPVAFRALLQKGRHEGLNFIIITQHIMQIDVAARRLIMEARTVKKIFSSFKWNFGIFASFDADIMGDSEVTIKSFFPNLHMATREDWQYYDSYALRTNKPQPLPQPCKCGRLHRIDNKHLNVPVVLDVEFSSLPKESPLAPVLTGVRGENASPEALGGKVGASPEIELPRAPEAPQGLQERVEWDFSAGALPSPVRLQKIKPPMT